MTYTAKTQYIQGTILFLIWTLLVALNANYLVILLLILPLIFMHFEINIVGEKITYKALIFHLPIYKKVIFPSQITGLTFKRISWAKKCAVIKVMKGLNIRVINFYPERIYEDLIRFAERHEKDVIKTKDYKILEKMR